ncbi:hypothetical protein ACTFIW_002506 [Dictyostelium discoideum]
MSQSDPLNVVSRILNKISKDNFQVLIDQLVSKCQLLDKNESTLFIDNIFEKVVEEPSSSSYYIQIINKIQPIFQQNFSIGVGNKLVENFNKRYQILTDQINSNEETFDFNSSKQNFLNLCKFMGECYYTLPSSFLVEVVNNHLPQVTKETADDMTLQQLMEIEIIATSFTSAGKTIESMGGFSSKHENNKTHNKINNNNHDDDHEEDNENNDENTTSTTNNIQSRENDLHFKGIQKALEDATSVLSFLIENRQLLPPRVRFMVKNLFELKNNKWIIPKAINDDLNAQREVVKVATNHGKTISKSLSEKCDDDSTLNSIFWKSFFQALGIQNYKILRQLMLDDKSNISPSSTSPTIPLSPFLRRSMNITSPSQFNLNNCNNNNNNNNNSINNNNMDIDASFDLNDGLMESSSNNNNNNSQLQFSLSSSSGIKDTHNVPTIDLNTISSNNNQQINLPSGFLSPKVARSNSPSLSSVVKQPQSQPNNNNNNNSNNNNNNTTITTTTSSNNNNKIKESPELSSAPDSNLSVIVSIIDSKIWTPQKEIWKKKIMNKIIPMKSILKKPQKIEILAAIWQNMCDNSYEYGSYLDLCLNLIKMDEGDISPLYSLDGGNVPPVKPYQQSAQPPPPPPPSSSSSSSAQQQPPNEPVNPLLNKLKGPNRRSSMATLQMKPSGISEARRSSISVPFELNRRGSLSGDIPSYCPPAPKLKSTPTLKSTPAIVQNGGSITSTSTSSSSSTTKNIHPTSESKKQPIAKKHKPDLDSFKDVLISSLQDDFALKMFVKKRSLTTYMELLKDLYREFIIEIPLLLKCISLVHNGLYELTDEECTMLFDLEEMAQEQQNLEKQNDQQQNLLTQNNQIFQWKTNTWEEKPQTPPPPPTSYFDLGSDVFVL